MRTDGERSPESLVPAIRAEVRRLDPFLPLAELATLEERLRDGTAPQRFRSALMGALGALALVLVGIAAGAGARCSPHAGWRASCSASRRATRRP
ncbi:MAG: hypothetical protein ABR499_03025 [Gemmatimonadaceae bacterium]